MVPTPLFLPGESRGQRVLAGCSRWGRKESETSERLTLLVLFKESDEKQVKGMNIEEPKEYTV